MLTVDEVLFQLRVHGWCVLEGVIPEEEVEGVRESVVATAAEQVRGEVDERKKVAINIRNIINVNQSFAPYLADERILGPARAIFGPYIRMRSGKGFVEYPGTQRSSLHADGPFIQSQPVCVTAPYQDATLQLTTVWMLSDFTQENGGTILVPGSHRSNTNRTAGIDFPIPYPGEVQVVGKAGSVLLFDNRLWHTGGANCSRAPRVGFLCLYFPWWLCQDQNRPPGTPERARLIEETGLGDKELGPATELVPVEVYEALPEDVKPLLRHWADL